MGILRKKLGRNTNCKHCIAVDLILKHNQKGTMLGRVRYIIYSTKSKAKKKITCVSANPTEPNFLCLP